MNVAGALVMGLAAMAVGGTMASIELPDAHIPRRFRVALVVASIGALCWLLLVPSLVELALGRL